MSVIKEDQANLLALVALLISTASFRQELDSIRLGDTSFTMLTIFEFASIAFGLLLYVHLIWSAWLLLRKAWSEKKRSKMLVTLRSLFLLTLWIIPFLAMFMTFSNWLNQAFCFIPPTNFLFDAILGPPHSTTTLETCPSILMGTILPIVIATLISVVVFWFAEKSDKKYNALSPELKAMKDDIQLARLMQAVASDKQSSDKWQKEVESLERAFKLKSRPSRRIIKK